LFKLHSNIFLKDHSPPADGHAIQGMVSKIDQQTKFVNLFAAKIGEINAKNALAQRFISRHQRDGTVMLSEYAHT
jgi:hypothetical protein